MPVGAELGGNFAQVVFCHNTDDASAVLSFNGEWIAGRHVSFHTRAKNASNITASVWTAAGVARNGASKLCPLCLLRLCRARSIIFARLEQIHANTMQHTAFRKLVAHHGFDVFASPA